MAESRDEWQEGEGAYRAFMLRCWREADLDDGSQHGQSFNWRFALTRMDSDVKQGFASLNELLVFLSDEFNEIESSIHSEK